MNAVSVLHQAVGPDRAAIGLAIAVQLGRSGLSDRRGAEIRDAYEARERRHREQLRRAVSLGLQLETLERLEDLHVDRCGRCRLWRRFLCRAFRDLRREREAVEREYVRAYRRLARGS